MFLTLHTLLAIFRQDSPLQPKQIFQAVSGSVPTVFTKSLYGLGSIGSGYVIAQHRVVTCWHVVSDASTISLAFPNGHLYMAKMISADPSHDIAVLSFAGSERTLRTRQTRPLPGERLYAVGAPEGLSGSIVEGLMSQARLASGHAVYQISNPVTHGNSGGPVLDEQARVIGMVSFKLEGESSLAFAIPTGLIDAIAKASSPPRDIETYRRQMMPYYHTFVNRHQAGDVVHCLITANIHAINREVALVRTEEQQIVQIKDGIEERSETPLTVTAKVNGSEANISLGSKNLHELDPFFHEIFQKETDLTSEEKRMNRAQWFWPPDTLGIVLKSGQNWITQVPVDEVNGLPGGIFTAKFLGFELVRGVSCAKVETHFIERISGNPIQIDSMNWMVYGLELVRESSSAKNVPFEGGLANFESTMNVTYWKFGPPPFNSE